MPVFDNKTSKSVLHPFTVYNHRGNTINLYEGYQNRCGYCYTTCKWSPDFYDKIYAKINASEILENQCRSWKSQVVEPAIISSATDAHQPAELKFELTRNVVKFYRNTMRLIMCLQNLPQY